MEVDFAPLLDHCQILLTYKAFLRLACRSLPFDTDDLT